MRITLPSQDPAFVARLLATADAIAEAAFAWRAANPNADRGEQQDAFGALICPTEADGPSELLAEWLDTNTPDC